MAYNSSNTHDKCPPIKKKEIKKRDLEIEDETSRSYGIYVCHRRLLQLTTHKQPALFFFMEHVFFFNF